MKKTFGFQQGVWINEFYGLLYPNKITVLLMKIKSKKSSVYKFRTGHIKRLFVPKINRRGKFGVKELPTTADYLVYTLYTIFLLPYILTYDKIIFFAPPFFDTIIIPLLRLFNKQIYVITIDSQFYAGRYYHKKFNAFLKLYYWWSMKQEVYAVKNATKVFATSSFIADQYKKYNKNVFYVPNGADVEAISKIKPKRRFKEFTITYMGAIENWRGIDMLIEAVHKIKKLNKNIKLLIIGSGPDLGKAKSLANNDKDIVFTGHLDHEEAIAYCKGSDALVMPSKNVILSRTISSIKCFEYVACEIPSIVTNSGEHAYWVKKFGSGLIVDPNTEGIKRGILELMRNRERYNRIKNNCKKNKWDADYSKFKQIFVEELLKD